MPIAGLYEIQGQIGSGGGGIVYLGRHIRLNKAVVLKADKRKLSANGSALRREVDLLKGLSHQYLPQVYDFVQEGDTVYTVMDYVDGESLDKLLLRGQKPPQALAIKWACQLLDALHYLHTRPPYGILHADIKPANIMLRPNGDICLIDFNIALALGENGAVRVGFSKGYASPEHYGLAYVSGERGIALISTSIQDTGQRAVLRDPGNPSSRGSGESSTSRNKEYVLLDVRSDIYSAGATLYHLLSGMRPPEAAADVRMLGPEACSPAVAAILHKAMRPVREERYQSAEEMLQAFLTLYKKDSRSVRRKRHIWLAASALSVLFLSGGAMAFTGLKRQEQQKNALALSGYSAEALAGGDVSGAIRLALEAIPEHPGILDAPVTAEAQKALTDALKVYDLSERYQPLDSIQLPDIPFQIVPSPGGTRFAVTYAYELAVYNAGETEALARFPTQESALSDVAFANEDLMIFAGAEGVTSYDLAKGERLWIGDTATALALSGDGRVLAAVNRDEAQYVLYDAWSGEKKRTGSFRGKHMDVPFNDRFARAGDALFALNEDGSKLAVSFSHGALWVFDTDDPDLDLIRYEESGYRHFEGGFCGDLLCYIASGSSSPQEKDCCEFLDWKKEETLATYEGTGEMHLAVRDGRIFLSDGNTLVSIDPQDFQESELAYTAEKGISAFSIGEEYVLVASDAQSFSFYDSGAHLSSTETGTYNADFPCLLVGFAVVGNRNEDTLRILKLEKHREAEILSYDARYPHDEARLAQGGQKAMLFSPEGFRIYGRDGTLIAEASLPDPDRMYDQQFRRTESGSYLEVSWYDGTVRQYDADNGELIGESAIDPPDQELRETFFTEKYRIEKSLHDPVTVYDLKTGKQLAVLERDAYLTYVTEVSGYIIMEYMEASPDRNARYGLLMNQNLETLAVLPDLCDICDGRLVFDYPSGDLRESPIYTLEDLVEMGHSADRS